MGGFQKRLDSLKKTTYSSCIPTNMVFEKTNPTVALSRVAASNYHGEDSPYFSGWKAYDEDPYDQTSNPNGVIQMGLAENQVSFDLVEQYLAKLGDHAANGLRENALFQDYHGLQSLRKGMASFMEEIRGGRAKFSPERIVITAGATAANELLTFILSDPGDAFLIPTPYYPGFDRDLRWRTGVDIVTVPCHSSNNFEITPRALESAYHDAVSKKFNIRGVFLTNPSNPLGTTLKRTTLEQILEFVTCKNIHLVSDEIYSGSAFRSEDFISIAEVFHDRSYKDSERVHIVYSLSKDLGVPGFRAGTIYSYNDDVVKTARRMSSFALISSQTQQLLASMLSDHDKFTRDYIRVNRDRLRKRYENVVGGLEKSGIRCLKGNAGLFCWMDLRHLMEKPSEEQELDLWRRILEEAKINISPGSSCHCSEPGWFRVCFANMTEQTMQVALNRMTRFVEKTERAKS